VDLCSGPLLRHVVISCCSRFFPSQLVFGHELSQHAPRTRKPRLDRRLRHVEDFRDFSLRQSLSSLEKERLRVLRGQSREKFEGFTGFRGGVPISTLASPRRSEPCE
jgi:hypothetical protein